MAKIWETSDGKRFGNGSDSMNEWEAKNHQKNIDENNAAWNERADRKAAESAAKFASGENKTPQGWTTHYVKIGDDLLDNKGDLDGAIEAYTKAISFMHHPTAYERRGIAYKNKGDYKNAIVDFNNALSSKDYDVFFKPSGAYFNRACAYLEKGDWKNAIDDYTEAFNSGFEKDFPNAAGKAKEYLARAQASLGDCYYNGQGVKQDIAEAAKWYSKAADNGHAGAMNVLGYLYKDGNGVTKDHKKAFELWTKAADLGNVNAIDSVGEAYRDGVGVKVDYKKAAEWFRKSADKGNQSSKNSLAKLKQEGKI